MNCIILRNPKQGLTTKAIGLGEASMAACYALIFPDSNLL